MGCKKKVNTQLATYFPDEFPESTASNYFERLKLKILSQCRFIRTEDPKYKRIIDDVVEYQLSLIAPKNFNSSDPSNHIKYIELSFEKLCASLEELGIHKPYDLTVFQFYSKIRYFKEKKPPKK